MKFKPAQLLRRIVDPLVEARLLSHLDQTAKIDKCWEWTGCRDRDGYGRIWLGHRVQCAHRVAYAIFVGEIPDRMTIDHVCFNRACCNPNHLRLMSQSENAKRHKCRHDWVERLDGYEEQCTPAICRICGEYGCRCNWLSSIVNSAGMGSRPTQTQEHYFRERGINGNDHELEKRLAGAREICTV